MKKRTSYSVPIRILRKLLIILFIVGIPGIIFINTFRIRNFEVVGTQRYTPEQISSQLRKTELDTNSLLLFLKYHYFMEVKLPFIEKVDVRMTDTHSVTVYVYEKMVAGCLEFMGDYIYFDKDGIVVESSTKRLEDVPIIKGLKFSKIILNHKICLEEAESEQEEASKDKEPKLQMTQEDKADELFDVIINLTHLIEKYELKVDTITFSRNNEVSFDCGDITVLLGKKKTYDEPLSDLKNILVKASGREITIDMRNYVKGMETIVGMPKKPIK